jgi:predicted AlkP superfamily pyrophosphatase or phosphodiesterase
VVSVCAAVAVTGLFQLNTARAQSKGTPVGKANGHVLLLSVDGLHQSDLASYAKTHPKSALASLIARGISYTKAQTPVLSDSFPGTVAQVTGGNPGTTGIYYDDIHNHELLPAGSTTTATA